MPERTEDLIGRQRRFVEKYYESWQRRRVADWVKPTHMKMLVEVADRLEEFLEAAKPVKKASAKKKAAAKSE